jgi:hypothetical protein
MQVVNKYWQIRKNENKKMLEEIRMKKKVNLSEKKNKLLESYKLNEKDISSQAKQLNQR